MDNTMEKMENILKYSISGYHRYILAGKEPELSYVSENLLRMLGVQAELPSDGADWYREQVHSADRERYLAFLSRAAEAGEGQFSLEYRLIRSDGSFLYVNDTLTVVTEQDGTVVGDSVLADVSDLRAATDNLRFLNETIPCGFLKYTCDKQPKITYINPKMKEILRFPDKKEGELDYLDMYRDNIFLMIPMEDRRRFALYLRKVHRQGAPLAGEMTVLRCDGTRAYLFGWVTKNINEDGVEEFQSVCMDITEKHQKSKAEETRRYLKALTDVYDKVFEFDLGNNTVKCLYGEHSPMFRWLQNIPMQMEEATGKWIRDTVFEEDRSRVLGFFRNFYDRKYQDGNGKPPQITYRALSSSGRLRTYTGLFLRLDSSVSLFCCRNVPEAEEADLLRDENRSLRSINENMQELVMQFTEGIAAFEVKGDQVTPLYSSDNVRQFFGFSLEEWMTMMKKSNDIRSFVSRSGVAYEAFMELLQVGEAEFTYFDLQTKATRRIKAICSRKFMDGSAPRYIMLYNVEEGSREKTDAREDRTVMIRTFGYFDVFVNDRPIAFRSQKSKELFALLVDRRGGFVSSEEAISFLWEEEPVNSVTLARYRKVALRLKNILEEYGIPDVVESVDGKRRIVPERVQCDLYDYLTGREEYAGLFKGSYLTNYSWGENTLGELTGERLY